MAPLIDLLFVDPLFQGDHVDSISSISQQQGEQSTILTSLLYKTLRAKANWNEAFHCYCWLSDGHRFRWGNYSNARSVHLSTDLSAPLHSGSLVMIWLGLKSNRTIELIFINSFFKYFLNIFKKKILVVNGNVKVNLETGTNYPHWG